MGTTVDNRTDEEPALANLVIIGIPRGGNGALSSLVGMLTQNIPAPILLVQSADSRAARAGDGHLSLTANINAELLTDNSELQPGQFYIVPNHRQIAFRDHRINIEEVPARTNSPSLDTLLNEVAHSYGERVIAVFLAGMWTDGTAGAVEVKNAGGIVVTQQDTSTETSFFPPAIVDFEVPIQEIPGLLSHLLSRSEPLQDEREQEKPASESTQDLLQEILEIVSRQASIDFRLYKTSTILRRIDHRMMATHCRTMRDYIEYLKMYPEEIGRLVQAFLINVTQFFRDAEAFSYLKSELIPRLITRARWRDRVLRFWTAGCATGEEPYSLAMLLTDLLGAELPEWSIKIFATDLDEGAIAFARRGVYTENLLKGMPREYRDRFFERIEQGYRISKTLRQMVIFGQQDLSRSAPFPRIDLVLCRNVLIYFTPELQDYVLNQFAFSLSPDGYLFLGKAETVRPTQTFYELINKHWKVYRCTGNALPSIRRQMFSDSNLPSLEGRNMNRQSRPGGKPSPEQEPVSPGLETAQLRRLNELLLRFLPIGVVVIDRVYHILTTNGAARRLLGLHDMANEQDFLHMVRGIPYHETRMAIDTVFREHSAVTLPEVELTVSAGGSGRFVCLSLAPMQLETGFTDLTVISVTDVTEQVQTRRQLETVQTEQTQLMQELGTANKRLSDMNKELMDANEELQVANEELVLTHEELQASIEEFETTNEELQAANEELETNNEELQATNEELETTNDELRASTNELQELTTLLEHERSHLNEIIEQAPFYTLILQTPRFIVETYNARYSRLLDERELRDQPLEDFVRFLWSEEDGRHIMQEVRAAYTQEMPRTLLAAAPALLAADEETEEKTQASCIYICVPAHDTGGKVNGVILYAVNAHPQS